ncbi:MAG TPA: RluA family pseudouridine synthase [Firmicutes bacterium]|jgi:23S rRNA pseudouridine1911/1915/1917 synthase|nr:RluA family pseudouridine synthase [Bacillota bacterium]
MSQSPPLRLSILSVWKGRTVESVLRQELQFSRRQIIALKKSNGLFLEGKPVRAKTILHGGEELVVRFPLPPPQQIRGEKIDLSIVYEDPDLIVVNKPAGMLVHPVRYHLTGTVANALVYHWHTKNEKAAVHPVHRLDQPTSGLLLIAKSSWAHQQLSLQLTKDKINRRYLAVTDGIPPNESGLINAPVLKGTEGIKRVISPAGQEALTRYRVLNRTDRAALLLVKLITGRTHQIRVHFASMGAALWGDPLYGRVDPNFPRPALHAVSLGFYHPRHHRRLRFRAPLPADLNKLTATLGLRREKD